MKPLILIAAVVLLGFQLSWQTSIGWKGIVPLRSTRADVERLFGPSTDECGCLYSDGNATIQVDYAKEPCKGIIPGWNVPTDTVLRFTVRPNTQKRFSDLKIDLSKYTVRRDDAFTSYYSDSREGIEYEISPDGAVNAISYLPGSGDGELRCSGFPEQDSGITSYLRFDEYGDLDFVQETSRLDTFAVNLQKRTDLKGYVIVYAGRIACPDEGRLRAERAKKYLIEKRHLDESRITAIDGGHRLRVSVELYTLPKDSAPTIVPTVSTKEVTFVRTSKCRELAP